ncbi:hypothetical protein ACFSQU_21575 [Massilia sp. GCM10020059]|uniref:hypothetical protein n=1 Tax=Massilia TaxID=149698 RepID=UPI0035309190
MTTRSRRTALAAALAALAGKVHDARNTGTGVLRLVGVYVVEKGKPLASPPP